MQYKLGIDLGTASVGAVAIELVDGEPKEIAWHAVRIFSEPLASTQTGLKARSGERRMARLQRRQIERRARRLRRLAELLRLLGPQWEAREKTAHMHLTELRARAARERIEPWEFGCVLLRMAKRRGYSGGFRDVEGGTVRTASEQLQQHMDSLAAEQGVERVTLGEYIWHRQRNGLPVYLKAERGVKDREPVYALREMVEHEFQYLWSVQARFHPQLQGDYLGKAWRDWFHDALFYQRPLKPVSGMVGNCLLKPNLPRAPRAHMAFQRFRTEKTLHDLRWGGGRRRERLNKAQLDMLRELLAQPDNDKALLSFKQISKALEKAGLGDPQGRTLNLENGGRDSLTGNRTLAAWRKLGLLEDWQQLASRDQTTVINLLGDIGSPEQLLATDWHLQMPKARSRKDDPNPYRTFSLPVIEFINRLCRQSNDKGEPVYDRFSAMGFESGRCSYSVKAMEKLNEWFADPWWPDSGPGAERCGQIDEEAALRVCYPQLYAGETRQLPELDAPPATGNAVVDVALRQLRRVINQCIAALGSTPREIIIEMGREVGRGVEWRNEQNRRMRGNEDESRKIAAELEAHGVSASTRRILKYQLWREQDEQWCPYCNNPISFEAATGGMTHAEHILPRSLTQVGRKRSELVLAHASCNDLKGDSTPWQAFGHDPQRWPAVERAAARFEALGKKLYAKDRSKALGLFRKAKLLLLRDFELEVLTDESLADFADRQMHQTSWIARVAAQWVRPLTPLVSVSRGEFTSLLRHQWRLETVIPEVRLEEGFRVLDTERKFVSAEDFARFRRQWEGLPPATDEGRTERRLDKRLDHRHHAIDALVVALTSRSLYMKLARHYREEGERRARSESRRRDWSLPPAMPHLRDQALAMIRCCNLTHKPDRNPSGQLFDATAYGEPQSDDRGELRLTLRRTLPQLADEKSEDKTRKAIASIASAEVREQVLAAFEQRLRVGMGIKAALSEPVDYPRYGTRIWRVRCLTDRKSENALRIQHRSRHGEHHKYLLHSGYACLELAPLPPEEAGTGKGRSKRQLPFRARLVTMQEAASAAFRKPAPGVRRLFKGDMVRHPDDGRVYLIAYFKAEGNLFMVPACDTRNFGQMEKDKDQNKKTMAFSKAASLELLADG